MPILGTWHDIIATNPAYPNPATPDPFNPGTYTVTLTLDQYPDMQIGVAYSPLASPRPPTYRTYHFGIYLPPRPLLGESAMQLPTNTCIDLSANVSSPNGTFDLSQGRDFDILFAPSGQLAYTSSVGGAGHVFLWIRDPRKTVSMDPAVRGAWGTGGFTTALEQGGEQMIVAIKARGITGVAPVYWPDAVSASPYYLAQKTVAGP